MTMDCPDKPGNDNDLDSQRFVALGKAQSHPQH